MTDFRLTHTIPKVSVIIPNYNHARFLEQRIESVLNQTFQDFEIIFLDDASVDNSREIFAKYANHPKISHVIFNETNSGSPFKQWNKGFSLAKGEYIWIAESDDYSELTFLEQIISLMKNNVAFAYCRSVKVNERNEIFDYFWADGIDDKRWKQPYLSDGLTEISNFLMFRNTVPNTSAVVFRRNWASFKYPLTEMRFAGDWLFWVNILKFKHRQVAYIPEKLNYFRSHSSNTRSMHSSAQELQRLKEYFAVIEECLNINRLSLFELVDKSRNWSWIFQEFITKKHIFTIKIIVAPPINYKFIFLYYKFIFNELLVQLIIGYPKNSFNWLIFKIKCFLPSSVKNFIRSLIVLKLDLKQ